MKTLTLFLFLFLLVSKTYATIECSGKNGLFAKVGGGVGIGPAGVIRTTNYEGLFILPNGDRFKLAARDRNRVVDGNEKGPSNRSKFELSYQKYDSEYLGGEGGMQHSIFKTTDQRPQMELKHTQSNQYKKSEKYELSVQRLPKNESELHGLEKMPEYVFEVTIDSKKDKSGRWRGQSGTLVLFEINPETKARKELSNIEGEGVLESIQQSFELKK